jgi:hypothetical protein
MIAEDAPVALLGTVGTTNLEALDEAGAVVRTRTAMVGGVSGAASVARAQGIHVVKASCHDEITRLLRGGRRWA